MWIKKILIRLTNKKLLKKINLISLMEILILIIIMMIIVGLNN